jgi:hypothetical protein
VSDTIDISQMIAPGQENLLEEFLSGEPAEDTADAAPRGDALDQFLTAQEQGDQPAEDDGLPEKYRGKSAAEVYRLTMQEAQYRAQQQGMQEPADPAPETYTPELGKELYGETVAAAIAAAEINPLEMAAKLKAGEDVSSYTQALVEKGGIPQTVLDAYLAGVTPAPAAAPPAGLSDVDQAEIKAAIGGDTEFTQLAQWMQGNLSPEELADYNAVVDAGNKQAVRLTLRTLHARAKSATAPAPPRLIGGGDPGPSGLDFPTRSDWETARFSRRYESDANYRAQVDAGLVRSSWA